MSYQKPFCECKSELYMSQNVMNSNSHKITIKGTVSIKPFDIATECWSSELYCSDCGNVYDYHHDDKERIVKGEIKRQGY